MNRHHWTLILGALVLAAVVGGIAYNAGLDQGIAQSGKIVAPPPGAYPYYGWHPHRPWGFFFIPFAFLALFMITRRGGGCGGYHGRFDEWHRRAHERMGTPSS